MKRILTVLSLLLAFVIPSFALELTTEYGLGQFDSIVVRTPVGGNLSLNLGLDYKAIEVITELGLIKTQINGALYMPLIGVDYKILNSTTSPLSVSIGSNLSFLIPVANVVYSDGSSDNGASTETWMNDKIEETLKNYSSMILDIYARTNYKVAADLNLWSSFGFKAIGSTFDPDGSKFGIGLHTFMTKIGLAYDLHL